MGEAFKQMSEIKFALEDSVRSNFLEPLHMLQAKEIKDVQVNLNTELCYMSSILNLFLSLAVSQEKIGRSQIGFRLSAS